MENDSEVLRSNRVDGGYAYAKSASDSASVKDNSVIFSNSKVGGQIAGGYANRESGVFDAATIAVAEGNRVTINNGAAGWGAFGGWASSSGSGSGSGSAAATGISISGSASDVGFEVVYDSNLELEVWRESREVGSYVFGGRADGFDSATRS